MGKVKKSKSKRVDSAKRHKVERKKREHKRDLRRAAKDLKKSGFGPKRSKRSRELAKLALKISNADPDKEKILEALLQARENAGVVRQNKRAQAREDALQMKTKQEKSDSNKGSEKDEKHDDQDTPMEQKAAIKGASSNAMLYIPIRYEYDMMYQFRKIVDEIVFPEAPLPPVLPANVFLITCDARCAVQSIPWTLLDHIVERAAASSPSGDHISKILVLIVMNKVDCISSQAIGTSVMMLDHVLYERYLASEDNTDGKVSSIQNNDKKKRQTSLLNVKITICPTSVYFDSTVRHALRIIRHYSNAINSCTDKAAVSHTSNMAGKVACYVLGLPNTGRRSLIRAIISVGNESAVSSVPLRIAKIQAVNTDKEDGAEKESETDEENSHESIKLILPNSKQITLITLPEDEILRMISTKNVLGGDIIFHSPSFIEKWEAPEVLAVMTANGAVDKVSLAQSFCQPLAINKKENKMIEGFLRGLGHTVRREKGFNVSPMLFDNACTAGKISSNSLLACPGFTNQRATLLDSTYSNARTAKFVRIDTMLSSTGKKRSHGIKRADSRNALRLGSRVFIREFYRSKNVVWAIQRLDDKYRPMTPETSVNLRVLDCDAFVANGAVMGNRKNKLNREDNSVEKFSSKGSSSTPHVAVPFLKLAEAISSVLHPNMVMLPKAVIEFMPGTIAPVLHDVDSEFIRDIAKDDSDAEEINVEENDEMNEDDDEEADMEEDVEREDE